YYDAIGIAAEKLQRSIDDPSGELRAHHQRNADETQRRHPQRCAVDTIEELAHQAPRYVNPRDKPGGDFVGAIGVKRRPIISYTRRASPCRRRRRTWTIRQRSFRRSW